VTHFNFFEIVFGIGEAWQLWQLIDYSEYQRRVITDYNISEMAQGRWYATMEDQQKIICGLSNNGTNINDLKGHFRCLKSS